MKQNLMARVVFVLAAFVGGCYSLPPIQMGSDASSDYSAPRCESKGSEKERADCYRERAKLAEQLLEAGAKPESRSATPSATPSLGTPQGALLPTPAPVMNMQYRVFYDPSAGNAENGCGGARSLALTNNTREHGGAYLELVGDGVERCGNGGSLIPIIVETPSGGVRIAFVVPPRAGTPGMYYRTKRGKTSGRVIAYEAVPEALAGAQIILDAIQRTGAFPPVMKEQPGFASVGGFVIPTVGTTGRPDCWSTEHGQSLDERDSHFFGPTSSC